MGLPLRSSQLAWQVPIKLHVALSGSCDWRDNMLQTCREMSWAKPVHPSVHTRTVVVHVCKTP